METVRSASNRYWAVANVCALLVGAATRLVLPNRANPILNNSQRIWGVSQSAHYLFNPVTFSVVAVILITGIIRLKFVGFWSVLYSFVVGGILVTIVLSLR